jgi:hypothetical protein
MLLNPQKRYLLVRPRGGLNDTLAQLDKTFRYAERYERTVLVDLSRSGLQCGFEELFVARQSKSLEILAWSDEAAAEVTEIDSVYPHALAHRIDTYKVKMNVELNLYVDTQSAAPVTFDFDTNYSEKLLIHEQPGGGITAVGSLRRVALTRTVANAVARQIISVGPDYDAIHVRHSDYRTDYVQLFRRARALFRGRRLLICTDSYEVKKAAEVQFEGAVELLSAADTPETEGVPLHKTTNIDRGTANIDLFSELLAMAMAKRFLFTQLSRDNSLEIYFPFSGIASLVTGLRAKPETMKALFDNADSELIRQMFIQPSETRSRWDLQSKVVRIAARVYELHWNRRALRFAKKVRKQNKNST